MFVQDKKERTHFSPFCSITQSLYFLSPQSIYTTWLMYLVAQSQEGWKTHRYEVANNPPQDNLLGPGQWDMAFLHSWSIKGFMRIGWKFELKHMGLDLDTPMTPSNRPWRITGLVKIWTESCFLWQVEEIGLSCVCSLPWETIFGQCTCSCDVASFSPVEVAMGLLVGHAFF
jgi:hypothetical protein